MKLFLVIVGAMLFVTVSTKEECDRSPINTHELDSSPEIKKKVKELGIEVGDGASMEIFAVFDVRKKITEYVKMQNKDGPVRYYQLRKATLEDGVPGCIRQQTPCQALTFRRVLIIFKSNSQHALNLES
ncbi:hypothetical protein Q1695_003548 [Nippostrongylus brasiliensis]|nr:hypothetical protein Q1695_003548 [Nippostrongylus brasiliensis]